MSTHVSCSVRARGCYRPLPRTFTSAHAYPQATLASRGFFTEWMWVWIGIGYVAGLSLLMLVFQVLSLTYVGRECHAWASSSEGPGGPSWGAG